MSYYTPVDQSVLLALAAGLGSGAFIGSTDVFIHRWAEGSWQNREAIARNIILKAIIAALFVSGSTFIIAITQTAMPLAKLDSFTIKTCLSYCLVLPTTSLAFASLTKKSDYEKLNK